MGVSHLKQHAQTAQSARSNSMLPDSQTHPTVGTNPPATSGTRQVPLVSRVQGYSKRAVNPGNAPGHPENGGRLGQKSGQPKLGLRSGNQKPVSGGRLG